jgi:hypothetical protein
MLRAVALRPWSVTVTVINAPTAIVQPILGRYGLGVGMSAGFGAGTLVQL